MVAPGGEREYISDSVSTTFTVNAWCMGTNQSGQEGEKEYSIEVEE